VRDRQRTVPQHEAGMGDETHVHLAAVPVHILFSFDLL
jgi:hypothetical protein